MSTKSLIRDIFETMTSDEIRSSNNCYADRDKMYAMQLEKYEKLMTMYCFEKPSLEKWTEAHDMYRETLGKKIDNKEEWDVLLKVAKRRKINL